MTRRARAGVGARARVLMALLILSGLVLAGAAVPAFALPEGRVYEMVSPPYKAGYKAEIPVVAPSGESVAFGSGGVFAGADNSDLNGVYLARRGVSGWVTTPLETPEVVSPSVGIEDYSATLESVLSNGALGPDEGTAEDEPFEKEFLLHRTALGDGPENWSVAGGVVLKAVNGERVKGEEASASPDLCHVVISELTPLLAEAPVYDGEPQLYDLSAGCGGGESSLRLVGLNNQGGLLNPTCVALGAAFTGTEDGESELNSVSGDGSEIFFNASTVPDKRCIESPQLFVRLGGSRTVEVSRPLGACGASGEVPCPEASKRAASAFQGANEAGTRVFFTTTAPLVAGSGGGNNLYEATIGCPGVEPLAEAQPCGAAEREVTSLVQVSSDPNVGEGAEFQGVVRIAPDGSRVYFVARGSLTGEPGPEGQVPVRGADNLYVFERDATYPAGRVAFVGALCSGPVLSGVIEDLRCPTSVEREPSERNDLGLWRNTGGGESQTTGNGEFLVFATYGRLIARGSEADTNPARDVYRYDAGTGVLDRVSLGEMGAEANGNGVEPALGAFNASISPGTTSGKVYQAHGMEGKAGRAISEDGSRIVFSSSEPLSRAAVNGLVNVYEWYEAPGQSGGRVSIVSSGSAEQSDLEPVITPSGRDVFFVTTQGLVSQDTDGQGDVYDARLGGGFSPPPAPVEPCAGDACQGALTNPAPLLVPGSVSQVPGGNFPAPVPPPAATVTPKAKATPRCRKGYVKKKGKCVKSRSGKRANKSARGRK
jgi:hypothetical protein